MYVNRISDLFFNDNIGMSIGTRIKEARRDIKMTQKELSAKVGVAQATLSELETGESAGTTLIASFAAALGVSPLWLETGKGSKHIQSQKTEKIRDEIDLDNNPEYPAIRRVKLRLSAGISGFSIDLEEEDHVPIVFGKYWYQSRGLIPDKLIAVKVKGSSMEPGLHDGDTVVINTADTKPSDGDAFAVNYEGEAVIKRLVRDAGEWWLSSDNPDQRRYPRKLCAGDACIIIGRIVHKQSERI